MYFKKMFVRWPRYTVSKKDTQEEGKVKLAKITNISYVKLANISKRGGSISWSHYLFLLNAYEKI